ncbi:DUF4179 domain-containing protein [Paenibacillus sp. p3-SID867]|uniref:DUF4179 domain-containing protein n=1 Tax=Paenibacillus sp. p3-SID867 TaxID=2916363 RepID=UPI0021A86A26|nr:DUF4179 domain-containing protein [Paenibacillus sp. p3-SID867]MCT1399077.1 DUF4179 domain-containing protein [Paenibacillus sp. p3-SID867]
MSSPEEQAMLAEAAQIHQEQRQQLYAIDTTYAIQRGLTMGRTRLKSRNHYLKVAAITLITIMVAGLWLLSPIRGTVTPQAAKEQSLEWGALSKFKEIDYDIDQSTLESAIRNNYVQLINKSAKSGPYQINIDAVTADENKLILLYSAQTDSSQEIYDVNSVRMKDAQTGRSLGNTSKMGGWEGQSWHGRGTLELDRSQPFPRSIEVDFQIASVDRGKLSDPKTGTVKSEMKYSERMKIKFDLEPKFASIKTEKYQPNQTFMLGDHQIVLSEVEISPLMTRVRFAYDPGKKMNFQTKLLISDMVQPFEIVSKTDDGRVYKLSSLSGTGTEDGSQYTFSSNMLDDPKSMVLKLYPESRASYASEQEVEAHMLELKIK